MGLIPAVADLPHCEAVVIETNLEECGIAGQLDCSA